MGFYGNISNTAKTTFTFDRVYANRSDMDNNADTDGIFLGRYVLVDYGEQPIKGYYDPITQQFYNSHIFTEAYKIKGNASLVYQALNHIDSPTSFYIYDAREDKFIVNNSPTSYQIYFQTDVQRYGRGYDSTVWTKRYRNDGTSEYVSIAELNAVVPNMHLVVDAPKEVPITPYFDRDTTNIDYYLHMQSNFGTRVGKCIDGMLSDENANYTTVKWKTINNVPSYEIETKEAPADIYYNKSGFDPKIRHYSNSKVSVTYESDNGNDLNLADPDVASETINYEENSIGYRMGQSDRVYGNSADQGVYSGGSPQPDIYDWYFRLPGIGNSICQMWDKVYGYRANDNKRYLNKALQRNDSEDNLVTYDKQTLIGMINTTQDLLGYHFAPFNAEHYYDTVKTDDINKIVYSEIVNSNPTIEITLDYDNDIATQTTQTVEYPALNCLFYNPNETAANAGIYYHYAYQPKYTKVDGSIDPESTETYYYEDAAGIFHIANKANQGAKNADGESINPLYNTYYTMTPRWIMQPLIVEDHDTIYGILNQIHKLLGTNASDIRSFDNIQGAINIIKDIISRIDLNLAPGRLLHTTNEGTIETTETYYPSSRVDANRVLVGNPNKTENKMSWENRIRSIEVQPYKSEEEAWVINDTKENIEIDTNTNNNNTVQFVNGNKWIGLTADPSSKQTVTISHEIHNISEVEDAEDLDTEAKTSDKFTTQILEWDNAGHVTKETTKTWTLPNTIRNIEIGTASDEIENLEVATEIKTLSTGKTSDTINLSPANKWIRIATDKNNIKFGHLVENIPTTTIATDFNTATSDTSPDEFNTEEYTYDKAGHIISKTVKTLTLPCNYKKFEVSQSTDEIAITPNTGSIEAQNQVDTMKFAAGNKWVQLAASDADTSGNDTITVAHSLQGTAASYGEDVKFAEFGGTVNLQGYETDKAGHIIKYPTYTLTLPKGSYSNSASNRLANVITGMKFDEKTGAITTTSENVGTLVLTGYTKLDTTAKAAITAGNTINEAFAALDNRIETEEVARGAAITDLKMFKTINVGSTALVADSNADTLSITAGDGIVLTPDDQNDSFTISHDSGLKVAEGFYKFSTDAYGHISKTDAVALLDLTKLGVATEASLTAHVNTKSGNPHEVTAKDIGLEKVTNESKVTMFTDPAFTGTPTAPTATAGTSTTQIATTAFVTAAVQKASNDSWASKYTNFDAVYAAVKEQLEKEYTLIPKEKEEEENPTV